MITSSLAWPTMFDVVRNRVAVLEDNISIVNRTKLLLLTDPTEVYNEPNQGVGLKQYLWQYNTENTKAMIQDRIKAQLDLYEPYVVPENTQFSDGLLFTGSNNTIDITQNYNQLKMTMAVQTIYGDTANIDFNNVKVGDD